MKKILAIAFALFAAFIGYGAPNDIIITQNNATTGTAQIQTIIPGTPNTLIGVSASGKVANYTADATGDIVLTADEIGLANNLSIGSTASSSSIVLYGLGANNLGPLFSINDQSGQIAAIGSSNSISGGTARQLAFYSPNGIYIDSNTTVNGTVQASLFNTGPSTAVAPGQMSYNSADGLTMAAKTAALYDFTLFNPSITTAIIAVPTGTSNLLFGGNIQAAGASTLTGNVTVGTETAGTAVNSLLIEGGGAATGGAQLGFYANTTFAGYILTQNILSGPAGNLTMYGQNALTFFTNAGTLALTLDTSQNATFAKQINITNAASKGPTNQNLTPAPTVLTEAGNATTIDWSTSNTFSLTLNGNLNTVTFSNALSGQTIVVALTNNATAYTVTWGNSIKWTGGSQPVQTINKTDVWTIIDLGGTFYGSVVQNF